MKDICTRMKKSFSYQRASHLTSLWNRKLGATRKWHIFMITLKTARDDDRRTWQMTKSHFTWTSLEHFASNLYYGVNCSVGDPALTKRIEGLGTRMRWFRPHEQRVVRLWCFSAVLPSKVFSFSLSVWPRESEMRGKGVGTRLILTGSSERLRGSTKRKWKETRYFQQTWVWFQILLLQRLRYY